MPVVVVVAAISVAVFLRDSRYIRRTVFVLCQSIVSALFSSFDVTFGGFL